MIFFEWVFYFYFLELQNKIQGVTINSSFTLNLIKKLEKLCKSELVGCRRGVVVIYLIFIEDAKTYEGGRGLR